MKRARISTLHLVAKQRAPGFLEACMKVGKLSADKEWLEWDDKTHAALRREFNHIQSSQSFVPQITGGPQKKGIGLGDVVSKVATPIARALGMDCIDKKTNELKPDSGCAKRRDALNGIHLPFGGAGAKVP
jgi:hypothetical protein